jgi:hypothetical protein
MKSNRRDRCAEIIDLIDRCLAECESTTAAPAEEQA